MSAPQMPRYTCPDIDRLKSRIQEAYETAKEAVNDGEDNPEALSKALNEIEMTLFEEVLVLEELRAANTQLRECAEYWKEEAENQATE